MNMNQITNMILRVLMRKAVNSGVNAGINAATSAKKKRKEAPVEQVARRDDPPLTSPLDFALADQTTKQSASEQNAAPNMPAEATPKTVSADAKAEREKIRKMRQARRARRAARQEKKS